MCLSLVLLLVSPAGGLVSVMDEYKVGIVPGLASYYSQRLTNPPSLLDYTCLT